MKTTSVHGMWSSRLMFVLAATGSAVGLGNIWRFPYITSENGGGAFVLVYLGCIAVVGLPILFSEIVIGRRGRMSPINSLKELADDAGASRAWIGLGWLGVIAGFLVLSFYSVVAGWTLAYGFDYLQQLVVGAPPISDPGQTFENMLASPGKLIFWHAVFMVLTVGVVALGVEEGLERAVSVLMPTLFVLLLVLLGYGMSTGHFQEALGFLFSPDWSRVSGSMVVTAMGQAFFTLSLGMCAIMAYGAYLPSDVNVPRVGVAVAFSDTAVALVAGLAIFPIVLSFGLDPEGGGAGFIFTALPLAFNEMPFGIAYGTAFFLLLSVAAWTSSISLLEPPTAYFVEATNFSRKQIAISVATLTWLMGLLSVFGLNIWREFTLGGKDIMGAIEFLASNIMLPIGGLLTAVFAGWVLSNRITREELDAKMPAWAFNGWLWLTRVVTPIMIVIVLLGLIGII
ncbi:MAG: sodium-dependent transporter [Wenzhouxiangellaceae bacterium]|nr:sodium-dependent transporter [Wenzhouxiangellaceae bacterium]MBS3746502.1 sodium-dependent transporter [Wenzhouxiangellaceae bacterium]MBS3822748.1 sodium-dependent transporter [Wenzhouxiangellaceae bacterium]